MTAGSTTATVLAHYGGVPEVATVVVPVLVVLGFVEMERRARRRAARTAAAEQDGAAAGGTTGGDEARGATRDAEDRGYPRDV